MNAWTHAWEAIATAYPHRPAVVAPDGTTTTYGQLQQMAQSQSVALAHHGIGRGSRVEVAWSAHSTIEEMLVMAWACSLCKATWLPHWTALTAQEKSPLRAAFDPDLFVEDYDTLLPIRSSRGSTPGLALAWPCPGLAQGLPLSLAWIEEASFGASLSKFSSIWKPSASDRVLWLGASLCPVSWLSVCVALCHGATLVRAPALCGAHPPLFREVAIENEITWVLGTPQWLGGLGLPPGPSRLRGIIAPWAAATPGVRVRWSRSVRWLEVLSVPQAGFGGGISSHPGIFQELALPLDPDAWHVCSERHVLMCKTQDGLGEVLPVAPCENGGWRQAFSTAKRRPKSRDWDRIVCRLRQHDRIGEMVVAVKENAPKLLLMGRDRAERSSHVFTEAVSLARVPRSAVLLVQGHARDILGRLAV